MSSGFDPITEVINLPAWKPWIPVPTPVAGEALVFEGSGVPLTTIAYGERLSAGEARWGRLQKAYRVRLGSYAFSFTYDVPCKGDVYTFQARVDVTCVITNPARVVSENIRNVQAALQSEIEQFLRRIGRTYEAQEGGAAEAQIHAEAPSTVFFEGFQVTRFVVELRLNEKTRGQLEVLTDISYKGSHAQAISAQEKHDHDLQVIRLEHAQKLASQQQSHQLELQQLRFAHYETLLRGEVISPLLLLRLADHPDDLPGILQVLQNQHQSKITLQMDALKAFLASPDMLEASDLGSVRTVVFQLINGLTHQLQGTTPLLGQNGLSTSEIPAIAPLDSDEAVEESRHDSSQVE